MAKTMRRKTTRKVARKRAAKESLPRTTATTPIGILKDVVKTIREEPLRYNQGDWIHKPDETEVGPACGTICCVAGWVAVLTRPKSDKDATQVQRGDVALNARRRLGLDIEQADRLFDGDPPEVKASYAPPGSRAYMEAGVRHIESFMRSELGYKGPKL